MDSARPPVPWGRFRILACTLRPNNQNNAMPRFALATGDMAAGRRWSGCLRVALKIWLTTLAS